MPGPVVEASERVTLRTVERDDADFIQRSSTDPRIRHELGSIHHRTRAEQEEGIEHWLESESTVAFVVCLDDEDAPLGHPDEDETTPIGSFSARHVDGDRPWLAYWLLPEYHGEGYGREMAELGIDYVFRTHDVHGICAGAYDFNEASRSLLESMGFTQEIRRRESRYIDGGYHDEVQYGLLREEWASE
jgi:ribosomal-protein-alanine N-acetyltransferase